jgi:hypothetical protein
MPCFGRHFCISLTSKGQSCHSGKNAKEKIIVLLCVNGDGGDEEMPIIVVKITENNFVLQTQETFL